jgi:hypothetical protein
MGLFDDDELSGGGLGLAPNNTPIAHNIDSPLFKIGSALQGFNAGMRGQANPALQAVNAEMALRQRRDALAGQEKDRARKEQSEGVDMAEKVITIGGKLGLDDEGFRNFLKATAETIPNKGFGALVQQYADGASLVGGKFAAKRKFAAGELKDPSTGQPMPEGEYDVEWGNGIKKPPTSIKAMAKEARTGDQVYVDAAKVLHPDDPVAQAKAIQDFRRNPEGPSGRVFEILAKGDKATPQERAVVGSYQQFLAGAAGARAAGSESGRLRVRSTEGYQITEENIARHRSEGRTEGMPLEASTQNVLSLASSLENSIDVLKKNHDKEFLGPVKGTDAAFEVRRRVGGYVAAPLGTKETTFRQTLANISDQLLRARSGAQINEQEYSRLAGLLPKATDEPAVFNAGVSRFQSEISQLKNERLRLGTTPRGELRQGAQPAAPAQQRRRAVNPKTGEAVEWDGKAWVKAP